MKRVLLWVLLLSVGLSAAPTRVNLDYDRADLVKVLRQLSKHFGLNLYVGPEVRGTVTVTARDLPVDGAIALVLKMQPEVYEWKLVGNTLVVGSPGKMKRFP